MKLRKTLQLKRKKSYKSKRVSKSRRRKNNKTYKNKLKLRSRRKAKRKKTRKLKGGSGSPNRYFNKIDKTLTSLNKTLNTKLNEIDRMVEKRPQKKIKGSELKLRNHMKGFKKGTEQVTLKTVKNKFIEYLEMNEFITFNNNNSKYILKNPEKYNKKKIELKKEITGQDTRWWDDLYAALDKTIIPNDSGNEITPNDSGNEITPNDLCEPIDEDELKNMICTLNDQTTTKIKAGEGSFKTGTLYINKDEKSDCNEMRLNFHFCRNGEAGKINMVRNIITIIIPR